MADNVTAPAAGAVLATDEIGGVHFPRTKVSFGADGAAVDVSSSNRLPVDIGSGPFAVTGSFYPTTQPVSGNVGVTGSVAVTGTFWQATQPVSVASLPLPTGAATSAKQDAIVAAIQGISPGGGSGGDASAANQDEQTALLTTIDSKLGGSLAVTATTLPLPAGAATSAKQDAIISAIGSATYYPATQPVSGTVGISGSVAVTGSFYPATQPVSIAATVAVSGPLTDAQLRASAVSISAASLPLPTGAATSAKQDAALAATAKLGTAKRWFAITPDGNTDLSPIPDAIYVGTAGNVVLKGDDGTNATFAVTAGQVLPMAPTRVLSTGTTATGLVGLVS